MSSGVSLPPRPSQAPPPPPRQPDPYETLIEQRLRHTGRQVKWVDIATGLLALAVGSLGYLFLVALVDHWVVPGGLGSAARWLLGSILLVGAGAYFLRNVLPLLVHRINPVFAAQVIEQSRPSLKNSLINLIFLRREPEPAQRDPISKRVLMSLEWTTAADLSKVSADAAVDHSRAIHRGYLLAGLLAVCALYLTVSPKNPLVSFGRVVWPWADIQPPTRVSIDRVQPGDAVAYQGDSVTISARVRGLKADEQVLLYYTTADGQSVDQAVPMTLADDEYHHRALLPPGSQGMQQAMTYRIQAGDGRTRPFHLEVQPALTIQVESVDYRYPEYTGLAPRSAERQGDIRALEGTQITVHASASHPIGRAAIEINCDPRFGVPMTADGKAAHGEFALAMNGEDRSRPQQDSYQLRFTDEEGRENRRPTRYRIDVIRDEPPEVRLVNPPADNAQVPLDGSVELQVRAEDRDFALRRVALRLEREGKSLPVPALLNQLRPAKAHQGPVEKAFRFEPRKLGLSVGDRVVYLAEAEDNKEPVANRKETESRTLLIVAPQADNPAPQQKPGERSEGQTGKEGGQGAQGKQDNAKPGEKGDQGQQQAKQDERGGGKGEDSKDPSQQPGQEPGQQPEGQRDPNAKSQGQGGNSSDAGQAGDQTGMKERPNQPGQQPDKPQGEGDSKAASAQDGQNNDGQNKQDGQQQSPPQPLDQANAGEVFNRVLDHAKEQQQQQQENKDGQQQPQSGQPQKGGQPQQGQQPSEGQQPKDGQQQGMPKGGQPNAAQPGKAEPQAGDPSGSGRPPASGDSPPGQEAKPGGEPGAKGGTQQPKEGDSQPARAKPGDSSRPDAQRVPDNRAEAMNGAKPEPGQGAQSKGPGQPEESSKADKTEKPDKNGDRPEGKGGDREGSTGKPGSAKPGQEASKGTPSPQEGNLDRDKSPDKQQGKSSDSKSEETSPSISPKSSDSKGDEKGDRSGGGGQGGGQPSEESGTGTAGKHASSEQGGSKSNEKGEGETGTKAGDRQKADRPTGQSAGQGEGPGSSGREKTGQQPGSQPGKPQQGDQPMNDSPQSGKADGKGEGQGAAKDPTQSGAQSAGNPTGGGLPGPQPDAVNPPPQGEAPPADPFNPEFTDRQVSLALEHLKDQLAKEKPDPSLLDRLGWSRQDVEKFVRNWETMRQAAKQSSTEADRAKGRYQEALKSLGLSPGGTQLRGGRTKADPQRTLKESGRFEPPPEFSELLRAYNQGIAERPGK